MPVQTNVSDAWQDGSVYSQGIDADLARQLVKTVKQTKLKVQVAIQGEQLRVTGKKRDDVLQARDRPCSRRQMSTLPLQYINFRE